MIYVLIFLISIGLVLNILSKKYVLHNLYYSREIDKKIVEIDEEFEIVTVVENKKLLPVTFLQVIEKFPSALKYKFKASTEESAEYMFHKTAMLMFPYQRVKRSYKVFCNQRGRLVFRDVSLIGGDLLGLNTSILELERLQEVVVLPQKTDLENEIIPYGSYYGDISVKRWIIDDPILSVGIREYTGTEPIKTIHWPSSLRAGTLMVKEFDYTSDNTVMIALNIECAKPFWSGMNIEKMEKCISIAREVIEKFEEAGIPYGLASNAHYNGAKNSGSIEAAGFGRAHYNNTVESLGRIECGISMSFEELLGSIAKGAGSYTTFVIITPVVLEDYLDSINSLSEKAMRTVLISLDKSNLEYLRDGILTYVGRKD